MRITIRLGNALDDDAEALLINYDARTKTTSSQMARALEARIGESEWEYVTHQVKFPFPNGEARLAELDAPEVKFKHVIVLGAFDHLVEGELNHLAIFRRALRSGFELAVHQGFKKLAMAFSRAGWRLTVASAAQALRQAATDIAPGVELSVTVFEEDLLPQVQEHVLGPVR